MLSALISTFGVYVLANQVDAVKADVGRFSVSRSGRFKIRTSISYADAFEQEGPITMTDDGLFDS